MKDFMYVAVTKKDWDAFAILQGFAENQLINGVTTLVYKPGFAIDEIGRIMTDPGEYDTSVSPPIEITPPTYDERYHVNMRIPDEDTVEDWVSNGVPAVANVTWIEPELVATPSRVWLGGMDYFSAEDIPPGTLSNIAPAPKRQAAKKTAKKAPRNRAEIARKPANTRTKAMVAKKKKKPALFTKEAASKAVKKIVKPQRRKKK